MDLGHWTYTEEWPENCFGFIYQITNLNDYKKYIGKKQVVKRIKRAPLKGKKNKRHILTESDWKTYTGSSNQLNEDIDKLGKDRFSFQILQICHSKWELSYYEAQLQFSVGVLLRDDYYNGIINCRIGKKPLARSTKK